VAIEKEIASCKLSQEEEDILAILEALVDNKLRKEYEVNTHISIQFHLEASKKVQKRLKYLYEKAHWTVEIDAKFILLS